MKIIKKHNAEEEDKSLIENALNKHIISYCIDKQCKQHLMALMFLAVLDENTILYEQGSFGKMFYIIKSGTIELTTSLLSSNMQNNLSKIEKVISTSPNNNGNFDVSNEQSNVNDSNTKILKQGDSFGDLALLQNCIRTETIRAITTTELWCINNETYKQIVNDFINNEYFEKERFFNSIQILNLLDRNTKSKLCQYIIIEKHEKEKVIISEGEEPTAIYFIKQGTVNCIKKNTVLHSLGTGDYFGDQAILSQSKRSITVKSKTELTLYSLSLASLREAMTNTFRDHLFVNFIKNAFTCCDIEIDISVIWKIYPHFELKSYSQNEIIFHKGYAKMSSIVIIIEGNIKNKQSRKFIPLQKGEILFKDVLFTSGGFNNGSNFVLSDLVADPDCLLLICEVSEINTLLKMNFREYIKRCKLVSSFYKIPLFKNLRVYKIEQMLGSVDIETFKRNEIIFKESDHGDNLYIIQNGKVDIYTKNKYLRTLSENDFFGEKNVVLNDKRTATAIVKSDAVILYSIQKKNYKRILFEEHLQNYINERIMLHDKDDLDLHTLDLVSTVYKDNMSTLYVVRKHRKSKMSTTSASGNSDNNMNSNNNSTNKNQTSVISSSQQENKNCKKYSNILYNLKRFPIWILHKYNLMQTIDSYKKILNQLDHPFIVKMLKTLKNSKSIFFLMESVFGKDLISVLNIHNGKLTRKHSMFYFASMILVCEYLQKKNIIHRDIKPENIIIMENGYIKLIDFSCAKTIKDTNNKSFTTIGTPYYMSPEIIKGEIYSFETDIWAMAVVLYQCYCGRVPFGNDSDDPLVIYKSILVDDITFPGFVSKDTQFKNLMKQMLNKSKAKRLTTINSIKVNPYLEGFDWNSLLNLNFAVSYVPSDVKLMMNHEEEIKKLKVVLDEEKDDKIITFDNVDEHKKFKEWFEGF